MAGLVMVISLVQVEEKLWNIWNDNQTDILWGDSEWILP